MHWLFFCMAVYAKTIEIREIFVALKRSFVKKKITGWINNIIDGYVPLPISLASQNRAFTGVVRCTCAFLATPTPNVS